jgi:hypothetical protein
MQILLLIVTRKKILIKNNLNILLIVANFIFAYFAFNPDAVNQQHSIQIMISFFIHSSALRIGFKLLDSMKIVYVIIFAFFNVASLAIAPLLVDFRDFQLGSFNPYVLDLFNIGFVLFYSVHFACVFYSFPTRTYRNVKYHIPMARYQWIVLLVYLLQLFVKIPINGFNELIQFYTLGLFVFGFVKKTNNVIQNGILFSILIYETLVALTSGLIYPLVYLFTFIALSMYVFGGVSRRVIISGVSFLSIMVIFSILFTPVKMYYRAIDTSSYSIMDKSETIVDLILENKQTNQKLDEETKQGSLWRLTYPLSAFSLVYEKTPISIPYWDGQTYVNLLYKFIPRFLWKDKPVENMGQRFGHTYSILADDNLTTSMNTPVLAEAYMNFGMVFVFVVFIFMAIFMASLFKNNNFRSIQTNSVESVLNDINICVVTVVFLQWESNLSMMLGKIVVLIVITKVIGWLYFRKQAI